MLSFAEKKIVRGQCYPIVAAKLSSPITAKLDLFRIVLLLSVDLCDRCRTHVQHFRLVLQIMSVIYDVQTNKWREIHNTTEGLTG